MKKFLSILMAIMMVAMLGITAFADDEPTTYTITVNGAVKGQTYTAYKVFDLASYNGTNYAWQINSATSAWFAAVQNYKNTDATDAPAFFTLTQIGTSGIYNVTYTGTLDAARFARYLAAVENKGASAGSADAVVAEGSETGTATITVSEDGYYFVDTTLGALCALSTLTSNIAVTEKNDYPTLTKQVQEDSNSTWGTSATADRGQEVNFKLTVTIPNNDIYTSDNQGNGVDKNFVITDTLPTGMTYKTGSAKKETATIADPAIEGNVLTFTIEKSSLAQTTDAVITIVIEYVATVNGDAVLDTDLTNNATLRYGSYVTPVTSASVKTFKIDVFKYTDGDNKTALAGAGFVLKKGNTYYKVTEGKVTWVANIDDATEFTTGSTGLISFEGLDADTYEIVEKTVPQGYNPLAANPTVAITNASLTGDTKVEVENLTGSVLPSTGGIGTTIFYVVGGILMAGAVVLLVTKKKMSVK